MDKRTTETFKPYEPAEEPDDLDEYGYEERRRPNVLWGRVIALGIGLLLAFFLGRATAGGGDEEQLTALRDDLEQAQLENERLEDDLAVAKAEAAAAAAAPKAEETPDAEPTDDEATDPVGEGEGQVYVVQGGDTLRGIARDVCGDVQLDDLIAAENGIEDPTELAVGESLTLPDDCAT